MAYLIQPTLTIAIPTFNRSVYLDRALHYIDIQINGLESFIEIIVSDNCSTDETSEIVKKYIQKGLLIRYIKNEVNMGPDFNISQCFKEAKGKYIIAFGDDDIFNVGSLKRILFILHSINNVGLFFLNWKVIEDINLLKSDISEVEIYNNYSDFYDKVNQSITFISGIIVNSKCVKDINFNDYKDSCLVQVPLYLQASFNSECNIIHKEPLVGVQPENSGGYSFSKVFGQNMNNIFSNYDKSIIRKNIFDNIKIRLLMENFPIWIYRTKKNKLTYTDSPDLHKTLYPIYSSYYQYWLFVYPVIIMPKRNLNLFWFIYKIYKFLLRHIILGLNFKTSTKEIIKYKF